MLNLASRDEIEIKKAEDTGEEKEMSMLFHDLFVGP